MVLTRSGRVGPYQVQSSSLICSQVKIIVILVRVTSMICTNHLMRCTIEAKYRECPGLWVLGQFYHILIYDRHDVGLQIVGQPARDLARHFIQR